MGELQVDEENAETVLKAMGKSLRSSWEWNKDSSSSSDQ